MGLVYCVVTASPHGKKDSFVVAAAEFALHSAEKQSNDERAFRYCAHDGSTDVNRKAFLARSLPIVLRRL